MTLFPRVVDAAARATAPATSSSSAAASSPPTTSPSSRPRASRRSSRPGATTVRDRRPGCASASSAARTEPEWICTSTRARTCSARTASRTPRGIVADDAGGGRGRHRASSAARSVVKVQVQIGGRGKGGGVVLVDSPERAAEEAGAHAPRRLQGHAGHPRAGRGAAADRRRSSTRRSCSTAPTGDYLAMVTAEGGMDIEELAAHAPGGAPAGPRRPDARPAHLPRARAHRDAAARGARGRRPTSCAGSYDVLAEQRRDARRGQPARAAHGRPRGRARREGHDRRQRALAPARHRGAEGRRSRSTRSRRARRTRACST